jgi:membrane fusion protein (multidrug efflux system)
MSDENDGNDNGRNHDDATDDDKPRDSRSKNSDKSDKDKDGDDKKEKKSGKKPLIILAIVVVIASIIALVYWFTHRNQVSTDDAYTDGNVVVMAPKVAGYVVDLLVNDNTRVRQGDLLVRIDQRDYLTARDNALAQLALAKGQLTGAEDALRIARVQYPAQLVSAEAQVQAAAASLAQANASNERQHKVDPRATTQENVDTASSQQISAAANLKNARAQVAVARLVPEQISQSVDTVTQRKAQVQQAQAQLDQANLNLEYTEIRAPIDGFVTLRSAQRGSYLTAGQAMFQIVTPDVWVTANYKESQLGRMRPGDPVDIEVDAYSGYKLHGHVQSIQYGSGSKFSAFPAENATGNFVKIVQRVPVKIAIDRGLDPNRPLPLGLSVSPIVYFQ